MPRAVPHSSQKTSSSRELAPESPAKPRTFGGRDTIEIKTDSESSPSESIVSASLKLSIEQARKFVGQMKRQSLSKEHSSNLPSLPSSDAAPSAETYQLSFPSLRATTTVAISLPPETNPITKPAFSRTVSKIPTPLPRKPAKPLPTSSDFASTSSAPCTAALKASPSKAHGNASNKSSTSQVPHSIPRMSETTLSACATAESSAPALSQVRSTPPSSPSSRLPSASARRSCEEALSPAERRRTVVEVCEKVVIPQGKTPTTPPVTPFITVNCVHADKRSSISEVRDDQQTGNASKKL